MIDGDGHLARAVHLGHFSQKIRTVIRSPLQHVELPLMDHFVGEGVEQFLFHILRAGRKPFEQGEGQADFPMAESRSRKSRSRAAAACEHTN